MSYANNLILLAQLTKYQNQKANPCTKLFRYKYWLQKGVDSRNKPELHLSNLQSKIYYLNKEEKISQIMIKYFIQNLIY